MVLDSLSREEYDKNGKYHSSTLERRFGSWTKALNLAGLQVRINRKISAGELLNDLKRVANVLNKKSVTHNEYRSLGKYDSQPLIRNFGSWFKALEKAGLEKTKNWGVTNEEYFENLEEIWTKLARIIHKKGSELSKGLDYIIVSQKTNQPLRRPLP